MNRITLIILVLLSTGLVLKSQTFNISPGLSFSNYNLDDTSKLKTSSIMGFSGLIGLDYLERKNFYLSSNIGFIQKNIELGGEGKAISSSYVDGPIMTMDIKPIEDRKLYFSLNTLISLKIEFLKDLVCYSEIGPKIDFLLEESESNEKVLIGGIIGVGLKYDFSNFQFGVNYKYSYDFTENIKDYSKYHSNAFSIILGYKL